MTFEELKEMLLSLDNMGLITEDRGWVTIDLYISKEELERALANENTSD